MNVNRRILRFCHEGLSHHQRRLRRIVLQTDVIHRAGTPYQRLLESGQISRKTARELRATYESLNPAELCRELQKLRREPFELADAALPVILRRRQRGPDLVLGRRRTVGMA